MRNNQPLHASHARTEIGLLLSHNSQLQSESLNKKVASVNRQLGQKENQIEEKGNQLRAIVHGNSKLEKEKKKRKRKKRQDYLSLPRILVLILQLVASLASARRLVTLS